MNRYFTVEIRGRSTSCILTAIQAHVLRPVTIDPPFEVENRKETRILGRRMASSFDDLSLSIVEVGGRTSGFSFKDLVLLGNLILVGGGINCCPPLRNTLR